MAVLKSQEAQDSFAALLEGCSLARALEELEGKGIKHQRGFVPAAKLRVG